MPILLLGLHNFNANALMEKLGKTHSLIFYCPQFFGGVAEW